MKAKLSLAALALVAVAAIAGFLYWNNAQQSKRLVTEAVPEIPASDISNRELLARIQEATTDAESGSLAGLQELSRLYHANGFTNEAWRCYATLVAVEPGEPKWPYHLGRILAGYGKLEEATPLFHRAVDLDPSYIPSRFRLGDTLLKQNLLEPAATTFKSILKADPKNPYARVGLARVFIAQEDWGAAQTELEKAVTESNFQIGADLLGDVYEKRGMEAKAQVILQNIRWGSYADIPDPWSLDLMEDSYDAYQVSIAGGWVVHQGDTRTGLRFLQRAVELDPDNSILHFQIAGVLLAQNDIDKAEHHFKRSVELQPDLADAWIKLIDIARNRQSPTLVRRTLDAALKAAPDSPSLNIERAKQLLAQNRVNEAISYLERSIELRPHEAVGYIELAKALMAADRIEEAMTQMRAALKLEPTHPVALTAAAFDAIQKGEQSQADEWFSKFKQQPRITKKELDHLTQLYQRQFGSTPPR